MILIKFGAARKLESADEALWDLTVCGGRFFGLAGRYPCIGLS
jgi:hypothetical protein